MAAYWKKFLAWLRNFYWEGLAQPPDPMLAVFFTQLRAEFATVAQGNAIADQIKSLLGAEAERTWTRAYEAQLLLVQLKPRARLEYDVEANISKAADNGLTNAKVFADRLNQIRKTDQAHQQQQPQPDETTARLRALLSAVLEDLQWFYQTRIVIRKESARGIVRLFMMGVVVTAAVSFPFFCFVFERWTGLRWFSALLTGFPNFGLYTAMAFGLLGAYFSILLSARRDSDSHSIEDAKNRHGARILFVRGAVGIFGAIVLYFLLASSILASIFGEGIVGAIFPNFENLHYVPMNFVTVLSDTGAKTSVLVPSIDWCLLVVWSFVAGFSEKLVPDTLARVEDGFGGKSKSGAG